MTKYTKLEAVFNYVPKYILEANTRSDILSWSLQALRDLKIVQKYKYVPCILEVTNHSCVLPEEVVDINYATWMHNNACCRKDIYDYTACYHCECDNIKEQCCIDPLPITRDKDCEIDNIYDREVCTFTPHIGCTLNYKMFFESEMYSRCFYPMKYVGNRSNLTKRCNLNCESIYEFSVDEDRILRTNQCDGYICIDYKTEIKKEGSYQVPDETALFKYLSNFIAVNHWENQIGYQNNNAIRMYEIKKVELELSFRKVKGMFLQRATSLQGIKQAVFGHTAVFANSGLFINNNDNYTNKHYRNITHHDQRRK